MAELVAAIHASDKNAAARTGCLAIKDASIILLFAGCRITTPRQEIGVMAMGNVLTKLLLGPGELLVHQVRIEGDDHQMTVRMLVNGLFWAFVIAAVALLVMT